MNIFKKTKTHNHFFFWLPALFTCLMGYHQLEERRGHLLSCLRIGPAQRTVLARVSPVLGSGLPAGRRSLDGNPHPGLFCPHHNMAPWLLRMPPAGVVRRTKATTKSRPKAVADPRQAGSPSPELVLAQNRQQLASPGEPCLGSSLSLALGPPHRCHVTPPSPCRLPVPIPTLHWPD